MPKNREEQNKEYDADIKSWKKYTDLCDFQDIMIEGGGGQQMKVIVIKSKKNKDKTGMACMTYFHGGGAVALLPEHLNGCLSKMCLALDIVVFNVDYRLAPETKTPGAFEDGVRAVKYVNEHAAEYGAASNM